VEQTLALGSILPAAVGAGCCVATRRINWVVALSMVLMVLAMTDAMLLGSVWLQPLEWTVVLSACAVGVAIHQFRQPLGLERSLHLAVMAALTAAMGLGHRSNELVATMHHTGDMSEHAMSGHQMSGHEMPSDAASMWPSVDTQVLVAVALAVAVGWSLVLILRSLSCSRIACIERIAGAASLLFMGAMVLAM
jgi:hypothetical protein